MTIEKLLTDYWGQTTLVLFALGYFIKRTFDIKSKKIEINHSLFQEYRLKAVNNFYISFAKAEQMWNQVSIYDILNNRLNPKEIDNLIWPTLYELQKCKMELSIYFENDAMKYFEELVDGIFSINLTLRHLYFEYKPQRTITDKAIAFDALKIKVSEKNNVTIKELNAIIKNSFKS